MDLILRQLTIEESHLFQDYLIRNRDFLSRWEPIRGDEYYTLENVKKLIEDEIHLHQKGVAINYYISYKGDERIIGKISLSNIIYGPFLSCYLGYKLDINEINKGVMTKALNEVIDNLFKEYKLHRIEANILPRNSASIRVIEKLGFVNEGLSKKYLKINGVWEDHIHYVLLNEDIE